MNRRIFIIGISILFVSMSTVHSQVVPQKQSDAYGVVTAGMTSVMPLIIVVMQSENQSGNKELSEVAAVLEKDFSFSRQFKVTVRYSSVRPSKDAIRALSKEGFLLALFLGEATDVVDEKKGIEWRLYDTSIVHLISGKRYQKRGNYLRGWAHAIADRVWPLLTGQDPFFSTKIAYCQVQRGKKGKRYQHIYIADFDGSNPESLVSLPTICVSPAWNQNGKNVRVWYSEYGNTNVRLMSIDMHKNRSVISSQDGITMLPAFSKDGSTVVYSATCSSGYCQLFCYKKGVVSQITHSERNSMSPVFGFDDDTLYFCSDETGRPQICCLSLKTDAITPVTIGGFSTSPAYCKKRRLLAYAKMIKGIMQLFVYDELSKKHTQLTHDSGSKGECAWSPCGNYLIYGVSHAGKNRIAMLHLVTNKQYFITPADQQCSYPSWSPLYPITPVVAG